MNRNGPALLALTMLAIAGWSYNVNYDTRAALDRVSELRARIGDEREALQVLRVEWAWLNSPDRLKRLVLEHNEQLALVPLTPDALGYIAAVPYSPDMPKHPAPVYPPEMLVAAAPQVPPEAADLATSSHGIIEAASDGQDAPNKAGASEFAEPVVLLAAAQQDHEALPEAVLAAAAGADGAGALSTDPVVAAASEKVEALTAGAVAPATMEEAVTLALIEAGIVKAAAPAGPAAVVSTSARPGIPTPPARPAVWAQR